MRRACNHPAPCPSLGGARPMLLGEAIPRAPSLHRGGRHQALRPRLERGDAPARGTRRGSSDGMASRVTSRPEFEPRSCPFPDGGLPPPEHEQSSRPMETSVAGERGDGFLARGIGCKSPRTRTEAGASRGEGFTARGRARASKCVAEIGRQPQAHRSPFETLSSRRESPAPTLEAGQQRGRRGLGRG